MRPFAEPAIRADFCTEIYDQWDGQGAKLAPLAQMGKNMQSGMVLAMSAWYAQETYVGGKPQGSQTGMSWLDGTNDWGKYIRAGPCNETTSDDARGGPYRATFSDIRVGDIGTTLLAAPPALSQPPAAANPAPTPSGGKCCYNGCTNPNCATTGWCAASKDNCETHCNGCWVPYGPAPHHSPAPHHAPAPHHTPAPHHSPAPKKPPSPGAIYCPGGSLEACIKLCPTDEPAAFEACVEVCEDRCDTDERKQQAAEKPPPPTTHEKPQQPQATFKLGNLLF